MSDPILDSVPLKVYIDQRFSDSEKAVAAALAAQKELTAAALAAADKAVLKAENAYEKRFEGVNEFRALVSDQQRTLMPRIETELIFKALTDRLKSLEDARIQKTGEGGGAKNLWAILLGAAGGISLLWALLNNFNQ